MTQMLLTNRVIMGIRAAKRLAIALSQAVQRHEDTFGMIEVGLRRQADEPLADSDALTQ